MARRKSINHVNDILGKLKDKLLMDSVDFESYIPNIIEFCESKKYLNLGAQGIKLFPLQKIILKTFYRGQRGNEKLNLTEDELNLLYKLKLDNVIEKYYSGTLFRELVLVLGRRCVSGDTIIFDAITGESKTIANWHETEAILNVWTYNEESKHFEINEASTISQGERECFRVTLDNGDYVDCTDNHPLLTPAGWKELKYLQVGDKVAQADCIPKPDDGEGLEEYEAAILGYIIGDGNCTTSRCYFTTEDKQVVEHLQECLSKLSDNMIVKYDNNDLSPYQYSLRQRDIKYKTCEKNSKSITGRDTSDLFKFLSKHGLQGKTAKHKRVPYAVFSASSRAKAAFLNAYFSCDGHFSSGNIPKIELYSVNENLLKDTQSLLSSLGIFCQIYSKTSNCQIKSKTDEQIYQYKNHKSYRLHIARQLDISKFITFIGGSKTYTASRVLKNVNTEHEIFFKRIESIQTLGPKNTYDLSVYDHNCHNFIINNGLQMHNSGKDFMTALMALYEVMTLLEIPGGNPFKYYDMAAGNPIYILTVATSSDQARILFNEMKTRMQVSEYFKNKIGKIESERIWFLTPEDKMVNKQLIDEGLENATTDGSVAIMTGHSNSESLLGKRIFTLLLDEVASFKNTGSATSGERIYSALTPATADFKHPTKIKAGSIDDENPQGLPVLDSKIMSISSPRSEEGVFYRMYKEAPEVPERLAFRQPTWNVNLKFTEGSLRNEFKLMSAVEFAMEFGADFSGTGGELFIPSRYVDEAFELGRELGLSNRIVGRPGLTYYAHLDPAATSHNYALVILHVEDRIRVTEDDNRIRRKDKIKLFVVDHIKAWQPTATASISVNMVDEYIIELAKRFRFAMVSYDSWNSLSSIQKLRSKGIPSKMTQFRKQYKMHIYDHLEHLLVNHQIALPATGEWASTLEGELKHLKRQYGANGFRIGPDDEATITTDDLCVDINTIVFTNKGSKKIKDVEPGDEILGANGEYSVVEDVGIHPNSRKCFEIQPFYGLGVKVTENHPVEVLREGCRMFVEAQHLRMSDKVLRSWNVTSKPFCHDLSKCVKNSDSKHHNVEYVRDDLIRHQNPNAKWHKRFICPTQPFGYICGLYLAEGNIGHHSVVFAGNINEVAIQENMRQYSVEVFGVDPTMPHQKEGDGCQTQVNSVILRDYFLDVFGYQKAIDKNIPYDFMIAPVEFQKELIKGYFDGDGSFNAKCITFTTTSRRLALDVQNLLLRMRVVSSISISKRKGKTCLINGKNVNYNSDLYNVRITDSRSYNELSNILGLGLHKEQSKYHTVKYDFILLNTIAVKIRSIKEIPIMKQVANIKVTDSTFVANCVNTHNCDALAGACGSAIEVSYAGYPKGGTVYVPQSHDMMEQRWKVGTSSYSNNQWSHLYRKFGYNPGS